MTARPPPKNGADAEKSEGEAVVEPKCAHGVPLTDGCGPCRAIAHNAEVDTKNEQREPGSDDGDAPTLAEQLAADLNDVGSVKDLNRVRSAMLRARDDGTITALEYKSLSAMEYEAAKKRTEA